MNSENKNPETGIQGKGLWFGLVAVAAAFAINGFLGFVIVWRTCFIGHGRLGSLDVEGVRLLLGGISFALFVIAVYAGLHSYRNWRRVTEARSVTHAESPGTAEFVSTIGSFAAIFLTVGIIWFSIPLIVIGICQRAH